MRKSFIIVAIFAALFLGGCVTPHMQKDCLQRQAAIASTNKKADPSGCSCSSNGFWRNEYGKEDENAWCEP